LAAGASHRSPPTERFYLATLPLNTKMGPKKFLSRDRLSPIGSIVQQQFHGGGDVAGLG
jgi:hypothetical protein